jgi:hypothetical protein
MSRTRARMNFISEYGEAHDLNDGQPWSAMDIEDLRDCIQFGDSLEETAEFLCRRGTQEDVAQKAKELGLEFIEPKRGSR